jgi:hypothetical protein
MPLMSCITATTVTTLPITSTHPIVSSILNEKKFDFQLLVWLLNKFDLRKLDCGFLTQTLAMLFSFAMLLCFGRKTINGNNPQTYRRALKLKLNLISNAKQCITSYEPI